MKINAPRVIILLLVIALSVGFGFAFDAIMTAVERNQHPLVETLADDVRENATQYGIPESVLWATLCETGRFESNRVENGAIGLMQITPERFAFICTELWGEEARDPGLLYDPATNLDAGCAWLSYLYRYYGVWEHAHAAYYVGTATVDAWLAKPELLNEQGILEDIPDERVADYVEAVIEATEYYEKLYYQP